jgi:diguanylate cyclase (GGDEF)-like protein
MELIPATLILQGTGTLLVAALLEQLRRGLSVHFLGCWAKASFALAVSIGLLYLAFDLGPVGPAARLCLVGYCWASYVAVFLFWSGMREFTRGHTFAPRDWWRLTPWLALGGVLPWVVPSVVGLMAFHFPAMAVLLVFVVLASRNAPPSRGPAVGLPLVRSGLYVLIALFLHNGPVMFLSTYVLDEPVHYIAFSPVYDALAQLLVVFGVVLLATERVRAELELKNDQLAEAARQLTEAARTDPLTGLLNRRAFDELLAGKADPGLSGSVAVIDLNDLKNLNDGHGHGAGDGALRLVTRAVTNHFRVSDPIFRTGGDEFVVIMVGCPEADLVARLERVDAALRDQRVPGVEDARDLIISWGVAQFGKPTELERAVHAADEAMYACKRQRKSGATHQMARTTS